jgi:hypothetical protein
MTNKINETIVRGIDFLFQNQLPDGEFPSFRINARTGDDNWTPDSAIFPTALIAHSLRFLEGQKVHGISNRAKEFLKDEMHPPGFWKYWSKKSGIPIDPDLDDTCCAAAVLAEDSPRILEQNGPAILENRNRDGLFYTWIKPDRDRDNDIDSVVNANVLFYLKEFEGAQKVVDYLLAVISANREEESYWYYLSPSALYYMIARAWAGGAKRLETSSDIIVGKITQNRLAGGTFENEIETAMGLCSLLYFANDNSAAMRAAAEYLVNCQHADGSWPRRQFYAGPPPPAPRSVWFGSEALTTAFCLEALSGFFNRTGRVSTITMSQREHERNHLRQRRFRAYNVGIAKTGSTSIAGIFARYRTQHEFMLRETTKAISDYRTGVISKKEFIRFLRARDQKGNLEMDSASFNFHYLDLLSAEFKEAKFIATIRDCYSWLDSVLNNLLLIRDINDWIIDFGSITSGVDLSREMFASPQNLIRALPDRLDGILNYWAQSLEFTMENLPKKNALVIKTEAISASLGRIAIFLGIPENTLIREKRHLCQAPEKYNILHAMDFNLLDEKFEAHCGSLMRKHFPEQTLAAYLAKTQKKRPIKGTGPKAPATPMSWGSDQVANLIFELINDLQIEYKFERSVKILQKKLLGNRFMVGIYKSQIDPNPRGKLLNICQRMGMPDDLRQAFSENLSDAEGVGFGFEENEKTRVYKVYLDFMAKWKQVIERGPHEHDPYPSILGFKWDVADNTKRGLATYTWHPFLSYEDMGGKISGIFEESRSKNAIELVQDFLKMAARKISSENILYLDVPDKQGRSRRFDINMYRADLQLKKMYPLLQKILQHYCIPADKFHPLYNLLRAMKFGHLSGGIDKTGKDFLTIYFGIERIRHSHHRGASFSPGK